MESLSVGHLYGIAIPVGSVARHVCRSVSGVVVQGDSFGPATLWLHFDTILIGIVDIEMRYGVVGILHKHSHLAFHRCQCCYLAVAECSGGGCGVVSTFLCSVGTVDGDEVVFRSAVHGEVVGLHSVGHGYHVD